jgi:hypothetical protein
MLETATPAKTERCGGSKRRVRTLRSSGRADSLANGPGQDSPRPAEAVEEPSGLARQITQIGRRDVATPVEVPPKPTHAPDVHLKGDGSHRKPSRTLKGDIAKLQRKVSAARTKWGDGRKAATDKKEDVREEARAILTPVKEKVGEEKVLAGEAMKPVYKAIGAIKNGLDPANGRTRPYVTSFMISSVVSWVVGPQILVAAYERIRFHTSNTNWGILHGPGRWFRDTVGMAVRTGQTGTLIWSIVLGLAPMILLGARNATAGYLAQGTYQGRLTMLGIRWLTRSAYLVPIVYLVGIAYPGIVTWLFGSPWTLHWWQLWVMGLFCTAYYCTMWVFDRVEKGLGLGYFHVLLMVPLASIVTGALLYAPGAAW